MAEIENEEVMLCGSCRHDKTCKAPYRIIKRGKRIDDAEGCSGWDISVPYVKGLMKRLNAYREDNIDVC
jgi:hypothetical protein